MIRLRNRPAVRPVSRGAALEKVVELEKVRVG